MGNLNTAYHGSSAKIESLNFYKKVFAPWLDLSREPFMDNDYDIDDISDDDHHDNHDDGSNYNDGSNDNHDNHDDKIQLVHLEDKNHNEKRIKPKIKEKTQKKMHLDSTRMDKQVSPSDIDEKKTKR